MKSFNEKVVVITGASSGIGFSLAEAFIADGASVVLSSHDKIALESACNKLSSDSKKSCSFVCDVSRIEDVEALADFAWNKYGKVDVIVNNAGIMHESVPMTELPIEEVRSLFDINFFGVWHGSSVFGKRFVEQGTPAAIYNTGSENSLFHGVPRGSAYVASKHAVLAITESLREEMPDFVNVGLICPGFVGTEMIPDEARSLAMPVGHFVESAFEQIKAEQFYIVTHSHNIEPIKQRYKEVESAYEKYAPRYEGDARYDVRILLSQLADTE